MAALEVAELRRRNEELERAAREGREREEALRDELERTRERLRAVEEAEERLCVDLGELEAEAVAQAREDLLRIETLSHQLSAAHALLASAGLRLDLPASN
ncbi:response to low sulfur [Musa troglodytarum]|uniref:Response to low sulfur n=1 Tax=Musa troglodytarum TaxID=320322 RepID=A0A9E7FSQ1_9LILI|nr:response to low sulfur [Musa troglodytarum]